MNDAAALPNPPVRLWAWLAVTTLACTAVISYTDRQVLSLLVDPIKAELRIGDGQASLLLGTAFALVYGLAGLPMGWLADRWSRRNLIAGAILVWSLGTIGCGLAHNFMALFIARMVVGIGEAALSPAAIALISDLFPEHLRGRAVSLFFTGICVGIGASFLIGGLVLNLVREGLFAHSPLAHTAAWRLVFFVIGAPSLLWCLLILLVVPEPQRQGSRAEPRAVAGMPEDWRNAIAAAPIFLCVALASLSDNAVGAWVPSLMVRSFGADPGKVGITLGYLLIFAYGGGMLGGGWLSDLAARRRGPRGKVELCALAAFSICAISILFARADSEVVMAATGVYFALSATVTASGLSAILDAVPAKSRGLATAISFFLNVALGAGIGPTAVVFAGRWIYGANSGLGAPLGLTALCSLGLGGLAAVWRLWRISNGHTIASR